MAFGQPPIEHPGPPPIPVARSDGHGEPSFHFTCDDFDRDRDSASTTVPVPEPFLAESSRSSPAAFLHPHHATSLRPPTPDYSNMAHEDGLINRASGSPAPKNPFNFQTQFISTGPVKSVRRPA